LPSAIQVADRWHLMENASGAFLTAVRKSMRPIRTAIGATTINPELLTCAERLQYEGYLRRENHCHNLGTRQGWCGDQADRSQDRPQSKSRPPSPSGR
jgi:transposase